MTKLYAVLAAFVVAAMIGGTALYTQLQSQPDPCGMSNVAGATIGGPFELLDTKGETVTDAQVIDRPALVYFGYTFCPDVCPFDMGRNAEAVDLLKLAGHDVRLVFVTIDPQRDTPEALADYQAYMYADMVALGGSDTQIRSAAAEYKVYYARGTADDEFYLMDHSTLTYLMFPGNELAAYFKRADTAEIIAEKTACFIENNE